MSNEKAMLEQLQEFEREVILLCEDCKRSMDEKDFINFGRIINRVGGVINKVAPLVNTAAQIAQSLA